MTVKHICDGGCGRDIGFHKERYYTLRVGVEGKKTPRHSVSTEYDFCKKCYFKMNNHFKELGIKLRN